MFLDIQPHELISSQTIAVHTTSPLLTDGYYLPTDGPTKEELIEQTRVALRADIQSREDAYNKESESAARTEQHRLLQYAKTNLESFNRMLGHCPPGFDIVPVWCQPTPYSRSGAVYKNFTEVARPAFLRFMAKNFKKRLRAWGICDHGIKLMKRGLYPANENGDFYDVDIDHIITRSKCGGMADRKMEDPITGVEAYPVNHATNLTLLTRGLHNFKNHHFRTQPTIPDTGAWRLVTVPKRRKLRQGFMSPRQDERFPLEVVPHNTAPERNMLGQLFRQGSAELRAFCSLPRASYALKIFDMVAADYCAPTSYLSTFEDSLRGDKLLYFAKYIKDNNPTRPRQVFVHRLEGADCANLKRAFSAVARKSRPVELSVDMSAEEEAAFQRMDEVDVAKRADRHIRPLIEEVHATYRTYFMRRLAAVTPETEAEAEAVQALGKIQRGSYTKYFRRAVKRLPFKEAHAFETTMQHFDDILREKRERLRYEMPLSKPAGSLTLSKNVA